MERLADCAVGSEPVSAGFPCFLGICREFCRFRAPSRPYGSAITLITRDVFRKFPTNRNREYFSGNREFAGAPAAKGPARNGDRVKLLMDGHIINSVRRARFSIHLPVFAWHVASPSIRSQGRAVARTSAFRSSAWVAPDRHDADHAGQYHLRPDLPEELLRRISSRRDWWIEPTRSRPGRDFRRLGRRGPGSDRPRRHKTVLPQTRPDPCFIESRGARVGDRAVSEEIRSVQLLHLPATQRLMACGPRAQGAAAAAAGPRWLARRFPLAPAASGRARYRADASTGPAGGDAYRAGEDRNLLLHLGRWVS